MLSSPAACEAWAGSCQIPDFRFVSLRLRPRHLEVGGRGGIDLKALLGLVGMMGFEKMQECKEGPVLFVHPVFGLPHHLICGSDVFLHPIPPLVVDIKSSSESCRVIC